jgi:hypothetical protein
MRALRGILGYHPKFINKALKEDLFTITLQDYETVVCLIAGTMTAKGLSVTCRLDRRMPHR